jgi:hypothetical protein
MHQVLRRIFPVSTFALVILAASTADAGFISATTGAIDVTVPPASAKPGDFTSNSYQAWEESSGTLSAPLQVNQLGQAGQFDGLTNYSTLSGTLAAGTAYASTMIQLDPSTKFPAQAPVATITFTGKIIGLALFGPSLDASDIYGNPSTVYPHGLPQIGQQDRGIDFVHDDKFEVSKDGLTLTLGLTAGMSGFDEIRVFTVPAATAVPEPVSLAIWSGIGLVVVLKRRSFSKPKPFGFA